MKLYNIFKLILVLAAGLSSFDLAAQEVSVAETVLAKSESDIDLIKSVYNIFVFEIEPADNPEKYFTVNALKKLQDAYEFDCKEGPCYAFYALRTDAQDSRPGSDEKSGIESIEPSENNWYTVTYSDIGWPGQTLIKITDGKIDDYERI